MATQKQRLGRGLETIIGSGISPSAKQSTVKTIDARTATETPITSKQEGEALQNVQIHAVVPNPYQPRKDITSEGLKELKESIRSEGLLQPIVVRRKGKEYELIAGERRWRACKELGHMTVLVRVMEVSDSSSAVLALIENLQRSDLNVVEVALGYASLMRDFDLTQEVVADRLGKARASIANTVRILNLDREIQGYLSKGLLSFGHAKVLLSVEDAEAQLALARRIISESMNVRDTEAAIARLKQQQSLKPEIQKKKLSTAQPSNACKSFQEKFTAWIKLPVLIENTSKKNKIVIEYRTDKDLQHLLIKLGIRD